MVAGILSLEDDPSFRNFINSFIRRSQLTKSDNCSQNSRLSLPQVHAMNTLREVMINSRFRTLIVPHVQRLLVLATENLGSRIWAIQNCGLMLYRACLLRLPSGDSSDLQGHDTLGRENDIPNALNLALDLLQPGSQSKKDISNDRNLNADNASEDSDDDDDDDDECQISFAGVEQKFAALDLIAHIHPINGTQHDLHGHLLELLHSPIWLIRQRAAEVLALLTPPKELLECFKQVFNSVRPDWLQNRLHGTLLYCRELLQRLFSTTPKEIVATRLAELGQELSLVLQHCSSASCAPPVMAILLEITNDVIEQSLVIEVPICVSLTKCEELCSAISKLQGFYLVDRSFLYNVALKMLIVNDRDSDKETLLLMLRGRLQDSFDTARYLLERLLQQRLAFRPLELFQLDCFFSPHTPADVSSLTIHMVSLSVEKYPLDWDATAIHRILSWLATLARAREVRASRMVAQARIFSLAESHPNNAIISDTQISRHYLSWEQEVQNAARDDMDTYVRFQTAKALSVYLPRLPATTTTSDSIGLLLTLRELLSDDDEDVRSSAAQTASSILSNHGSPSPTGSLAGEICAPAAAAQLEDYLRSVIPRRPLRHEVLFRRLLGVGPDINLGIFLHEQSAQTQLTLINNESSALFAIERQNLYVDELHEIHFWSSLCRANGLEYSVRPIESVQSAIAKWAAEGLEELQTLLEAEGEEEMLPNATFNLDVLLLCVRVVCVAGAYLSLARSEMEPSLTYRTILERLRKFNISLKTYVGLIIASGERLRKNEHSRGHSLFDRQKLTGYSRWTEGTRQPGPC
jgi:Putative death-receptor fusion protein (DUF2428)